MRWSTSTFDPREHILELADLLRRPFGVVVRILGFELRVGRRVVILHDNSAALGLSDGGFLSAGEDLGGRWRLTLLSVNNRFS